MNTSRRTAIKQFLYVSAGLVVLPACLQEKSKASLFLNNLKIDTDQEKLLAEIAETIIPVTTSPGAKDISAHLFALKMVDDCFKPEDQQQFMKGMEQFEKECKSQFGKHFTDCPKQQKDAFIGSLEASKNKNQKNDTQYFYATIKRLTIQAYTTSQFYLTKINVYEMVPGRFHGCVPVKYSINN
ncbi:MAG: hypothetical protein NVSMB7_01320 [Chitinophagaceae bacterium]